MFGLHHSTLTPAKIGAPGYDFSVTFPNEIEHLISIKNIDASEPQKKFQQSSRKLRKNWIAKLKILKVNLGLRVVATRNIDDNDFEEIIASVKKYDLSSAIIPNSFDEYIKISTFNLPNDNYTTSETLPSDLVQVFCPPPESEYKRYIRRIHDAIGNIKKHTNKDAKTSRIVFIRVHVNADYDFIADQVKELVNKEDNIVDCIICYQPSYVRDQHNNSLINHCIKIEASADFALKMAGADWYKVTFPIGSISQKQSITQIIDLETGYETQLSASDYIFQQGDFYISAKSDNKGGGVL